MPKCQSDVGEPGPSPRALGGGCRTPSTAHRRASTQRIGRTQVARARGRDFRKRGAHVGLIVDDDRLRYLGLGVSQTTRSLVAVVMESSGSFGHTVLNSPAPPPQTAPHLSLRYVQNSYSQSIVSSTLHALASSPSLANSGQSFLSVSPTPSRSRQQHCPRSMQNPHG